MKCLVKHFEEYVAIVIVVIVYLIDVVDFEEIEVVVVIEAFQLSLIDAVFVIVGNILLIEAILEFLNIVPEEEDEQENVFDAISDEELQIMLDIAIEEEDYEKAAKVRDELNKRSK